MIAIKVALNDAEKTKLMLQRKDLLNTDYELKKDKDSIYFPIKKDACKIPNGVLVDIQLNKRKKNKDLKSRLSEKLSASEIKHLKTSMDLVGDIAIIELEPQLEKKAGIIAKEFLRQNKGIRTVLKKKGGHEGEFRVQKYAFLSGDARTETTHVENRCRILLDVNTVYFSTRLATERKRIAEQVKKGEHILVMFSGCAPYPCVLAKNTQAKHIVGVEINPEGHKYGQKNLVLNKLSNVSLYLGDVKAIVPKLNTLFDRIIMPLPRTAEDFLDTALAASKKDTVIHFYNFQRQGEFKLAEEKVKAACSRQGKKCRILNTVACGQNAPRFYRICVDFKILTQTY